MITEGLRADDEVVRTMAETLADGDLKVIRAYLDNVQPGNAQALADYITVTLRGLSASACNGISRKQLIDVAQTAGRFIETVFMEPAADLTAMRVALLPVALSGGQRRVLLADTAPSRPAAIGRLLSLLIGRAQLVPGSSVLGRRASGVATLKGQACPFPY